MTARRQLAQRLLTALQSQASSESDSWATAMLRELDYVEGNWSALWWALGGAAALIRHGAPRYLRARLAQPSRLAHAMSIKRVGTTTVGVAFGAFMAAGMMAICLATLVRLPHMSWPELVRSSALERVLVIVGLETICTVVAAAVWRHRRSVATGALVAGTTLFLHVVTYG
jgi:hypothetical protein